METSSIVRKALSLAPSGTHKYLRVVLSMLFALAAVLPSAGLSSIAQAVPAFTALEVFAADLAEPLEVPATNFSSPRDDTTVLPEGLPSGSFALFVIQGVVKDVKTDGDGVGQEWQIGSPPMFVYTSGDTRIDNAPQKNQLVKVIGLRTLARGPIVAERIALRQPGFFSVGEADVETAFLFSGGVTAAGDATWTVGGVTFIVNDPNFPAEIDPGLGAGSDVTVEFMVGAEVAPPPELPPGGVAGPFTALEVFAADPAEPLKVPATNFSSPIDDTTVLPEGLPVGSFALFVIQGVVKDIKTDGDGVGQEWQIGSQPMFVYTSGDTRIDNAPQKNQLVKVIGLRTLARGPIVAERITLRQPGFFSVGEADVETAFLFSGGVTAAGDATWTVGGVTFVVNDPNFPAEIDPGLGAGSDVTVEFATAPTP